ncbi:MAG: nucleotidyltransferase family protein [Oscillospiraceae bacterium]
MQAAGIVCEYNPFHKGHALHIAETKRALGKPIVCVMSGNFVQRGDFAMLRKHARAKAAVLGGADLVLELPAAQALLSAEGFARAACGALAATGVVDTVSYGSECGDAAPLREAAEALDASEFPTLLRGELAQGLSFAAAREAALARLIGPEKASILEKPNNILAIEYEKACRALGLATFTIPRVGAAHDGEAADGVASASFIRAALLAGQDAEGYLTAGSAAAFAEERAAGRAPVTVETAERAILARLRSMEPEDFAPYDEGGEGLYRRFAAAAAEAASVETLLERVKTKRYAMARLRRMLLRSYLGLSERETAVSYLRVLACSETGRGLLREMKDRAALPVVTKPAEGRKLPETARRAFETECRCADLYALAYPDLSRSAGGGDWTAGPVIL